MTTENDVKEMQEELQEMKDYPVKLSWKQLYIIIPICITVIGSSFGFGIKIQYEVSKLEMTEMKQKFLIQLNDKDMALMESNRKQRENFENMTFFQNQYTVYKDRYEKCESKSVFTKAVE